jgi:hypothetical protein
MSRTEKIEEVPPKFDEECNPIIIEECSKTGGSNATTLEDLMRQLEKLMTKNKKLIAKVKSKKTKGNSSSTKEEDSSFEEEVSKKRRKEEEISISLLITQCLLITIVCLAVSLTLPCPLTKLPVLMELIIINRSIA